MENKKGTPESVPLETQREDTKNFAQPNFDFSLITPETINDEIEQMTAENLHTPKNEILKSLFEQIQPIDFVALQYPNLTDEERKEKKVNRSEIRVLILNEILKTAEAHNWALCKQGGFCYLYNGAYWETLNEDDLKHFLSDCAKAMGFINQNHGKKP